MTRTPIVLAAALLVTGCGAPSPEGTPGNGQGAAAPPAAQAAAPAAEAPTQIAADAAKAAPAKGAGSVGPLNFRYDPAKFVAVATKLSVPPDWASEVAGTKLLAADRAVLIGKAECMYGQSGEASLCHAQQEAGLAFALVEEPYEQLAAKLTDPAKRSVRFGGREGVSWQIGAEGDGAEHILLPAAGRTILIVRQFRAVDDADQAAIAEVLQGVRFES